MMKFITQHPKLSIVIGGAFSLIVIIILLIWGHQAEEHSRARPENNFVKEGTVSAIEIIHSPSSSGPGAMRIYFDDGSQLEIGRVVQLGIGVKYHLEYNHLAEFTKIEVIKELK